MKTDLTQEQIDAYQRDGCLIVKEFLTTQELDELISAVSECVKQMGKWKVAGDEDKKHVKDVEPIAAEMKAGDGGFHNGLTSHGAGPNMTPGWRRAMTCAYMPDGATFNGIQNILSDAQVAKLKMGDLLNDESQNPLVWSSSM